MEQATDLQSKLFKNYSGTVRPVKNAKTDGPISIDLYFQVTHIEEVVSY